MTDEEIARFALQLKEAERVRAQIARDEAAQAVSGEEPPPLTALPMEQQPPASALVAA